jgi:hypothetical protein
MVCINSHSHPDPFPTRTPNAVKDILEGLLLKLGWRLADATPRRLHIEASFLGGLRRVLNCSEFREPTLSDLHPSLGNWDHIGRLINNLRHVLYPAGTGFEGKIIKLCAVKSH